MDAVGKIANRQRGNPKNRLAGLAKKLAAKIIKARNDRKRGKGRR